MNSEPKCNSCLFNKHYTTGEDEYPQNTVISYCVKGKWENSVNEESEKESDAFKDCEEFVKQN